MGPAVLLVKYAEEFGFRGAGGNEWKVTERMAWLGVHVRKSTVVTSWKDHDQEDQRK